MASKGNNGKEFSSDDEASPRAILEAPVSETESDNSGSSSFSSCSSERSPAASAAAAAAGGKAGGRESHMQQWKSMIDVFRFKSVRRLTAIPLLAASHDISRKSLTKKLARIRSAEESIDIGAIPTKPSWRNFEYAELAAATHDFSSGDDDMDRIISNIPGMENSLRCRDLPSVCRTNKKLPLPLDMFVLWSQQSLEADALILNTFEDLEGPVLSQVRLHFPKLYTLGPLHHHLNTRKPAETKPSFKSSFFEVDRSCMTWLDSQPLKSVIYVSFGSITPLKREELMEIWHGLVNSKKRFLWVMRPNMEPTKEGDEDKVMVELEEGTKERGYIVGWAPQEEVLAHKAVGGFLTHSGWNSTLEAVVAGVPMICWPCFADQQINSRFVSEVWKLGLDMKDVCDRNVVENMVNNVMVHRKEEFLRSAQEMAELGCKSVSPGGSSYTSLDELIQFIKTSSPQKH